MVKLEDIPVTVRRFCNGSVEDVAAMERAEGLQAAKELIRASHPHAVFVRCCEHEADGGCVFVYPQQADLDQDESDLDRKAEQADGETPAGYGRWVALISSAEQDEPVCKRPSTSDKNKPA